MRALCWQGDRLAVAEVPDPELRNGHDAIVRVRRSAACGTDLHLIDGGGLAPGDVLGHEFLGEVVEVGPRVRRHRVGDRVVVASVVACGRCRYCRQGRHSCCDNGSVDPVAGELAWGQAPAGCYGHPSADGGFPGSHAEYVRVPYADVGAFTVPDGVPDERAVFASDAAPAGWTGVDVGGVRPGDVVAVWGAGAVGQLVARAAVLRGAARVVVIDRYDERLRMVERHTGAETVHYHRADVTAELRERSGGRGPDVCVEAAGAVDGSRSLAERLRRAPRTPLALREAVHACRKGGTVVVLGDVTGFVDTFPVGAVVQKELTVRGARPHGPRHIPELLDRMARDELRTEHLATHRFPLAEGAAGYALFRERADGCVRVVFTPG
ncbi:alcohol dehydrogenase catalytic domain-containing protein [Micromonospora sagamiensis]|uniref:Threonine dehydrogenase-like Zn-dependent dehydrogenase n=1 Tax=Micromonospora sagamiensis TaxID=47875 RepID=A0A562WCX0_9ACTN|nr:alcohol dehydrogenase catalytic domain-containing protein [Micromonospora sagamiensis]TWJ27881.1 threonine dehydrogenase-like Zn-dependent dehydrogenase [Micromonospora sagamiensis]BCL13230.1 glutathione-dependent formaldehyde dehydrogenase [Micromonospora sagamiensis]